MDETVKRAEELLEERMKTRTNGHTAVDESAEPDSGEPRLIASGPDVAAELTRDLQRLAADFSNYRKRNEAERVEFVKYAKADLIRKLLDVLDGYDRALETTPGDAEGQPWLEGLRLVERKLRQLLESEGLQPLEAIGQPFDPYLHEAVAHVPSGEPEGTIVNEYQKGYRLHDRLIRPALVTVSRGPDLPAGDLGDPGAAGKSRSDTKE